MKAALCSTLEDITVKDVMSYFSALTAKTMNLGELKLLNETAEVSFSLRMYSMGL